MKNRWKHLFFIAVGLMLLSWATYLRYKSTLTFYNLYIGTYEGYILTRDTPNIAKTILHHLKTLGWIYFKEYIITSLLFLASILLTSIGVCRLSLPLRWNILRKKRAIYVLIILIFAFTLWICLKIFNQYPKMGDESSYCFQASLISAGKLYAKSPPMPEFFPGAQIINNGKWYSKYTIGWPLLLSVGNILRIKFAVNPILAALSIYLVYLISYTLYKKHSLAFLSAFIVSFSPFFTFTGSSYLAHTSMGFFTLLYFYALLKLELIPKTNSHISNHPPNNHKSLTKEYLKYGTLAGFSLMFAIMIRPADAITIFIGSIPLCFYTIRSSRKTTRNILISLTIACFLTLLGVFVLLWVNKIQNGNPLLFGFSVYNKEDRWGFGVMGHSPLLGVWNFIFSSMRNGMWSVPLIGFFSLLAILHHRKNVFLLFPAITVWAFYFCFYSIGTQGFAARYHYLAFLLLGIMASDGIYHISKYIDKTCKTSSCFKVLSKITILYATILLGIGVYPHLLKYVKREYLTAMNLYNSVKRCSPKGEKKLIFLKAGPSAGKIRTHNHWEYQKEENLTALFLLPEENRKLMKKFPYRKPYCAILDTSKWAYTVKPYDFNDESPENYVFAGINYGVQNPKKLEKALIKAISLSKGQYIYIYNLGYFYYKVKKYHKAIKVFNYLIKRNPNFLPAYYYIGKCYGNLKKYKKACHYLSIYIEKAPEGLEKKRAYQWYIKYANKLRLEKGNGKKIKKYSLHCIPKAFPNI